MQDKEEVNDDITVSAVHAVLTFNISAALKMEWPMQYK